MSKFGVTKDGFSRKGYLDIILDMNNLAKELFGEDIDLSERNPFGMSLQNIAWEISELWDLAEDVYNSPFIDTSEGMSLDSTGKYIAISRKAAQKAVGTITVLGNEGVAIPKGFRISTQNTDIVFETTERSVIGKVGEVDISIRSILSGIANNLPSSTLTKIVNPISGVNETYNENPTTDGTEVESDKDFRERYYRSVSLGGSSTRESVEAALLNMPNITDAFVEENETMEYMEDIPPKSLAPYVFGGEDEDVAKVILLSKAGGIRSYGSTEVEVEDSKAVRHTIGFTRPMVRDLYIRLGITRGIQYPGDDVIKRSVLNYIGGQDADGVIYKGLKLGEDVVISKLIAATTCLSGVDDVSVEVSFDGETYTSTNISINKKEIARADVDKVEIVHVK